MLAGSGTAAGSASAVALGTRANTCVPVSPAATPTKLSVGPKLEIAPKSTRALARCEPLEEKRDRVGPGDVVRKHRWLGAAAIDHKKREIPANRPSNGTTRLSTTAVDSSSWINWYA